MLTRFGEDGVDPEQRERTELAKIHEAEGLRHRYGMSHVIVACKYRTSHKYSTLPSSSTLLILNDGNKLSIDDDTKLKRFDEEPEAKN